MRQVFFFESLNVCPHLETAFELVLRHLNDGDAVTFYALGRSVPYSDFYADKGYPEFLAKWLLPEARAARLVKNPNFQFILVPPLPLPGIEGRPANSLAALMRHEYKGADIGMGVASSLVSRSGNSRFDPNANMTIVEAALRSAAAIYDFVAATLRDRLPDLVYLFNGRFSNNRAVLRACQDIGVPYRIHERGANRTRYSTWSHMPHDTAKVQNEILEKWRAVDNKAQAEVVASKWFDDRRTGKETDWTSFTTAQTPLHLPAFSGERIVTYFSSSDDEYAAVGDLYKWEGWEDQLAAVLGLVGAVQRIPGLQLLIRLHPHLLKKHPDERKRWLDLRSRCGAIEVIAPDSPVDTYALLEASDVVVTGGSTVGIEAVYWGTPSILLGPSMYDAWGAVHKARNPEVLFELLSKDRVVRRSLPGRSPMATTSRPSARNFDTMRQARFRPAVSSDKIFTGSRRGWSGRS